MDPLPGLDGFVVTAFLLRLAFALLAIVLLVRLLPWIDRRNGVSFRTDILAAMRSEPAALAFYYGLRFVGCALLIGLVVS